jgi:O-antigen/teichoic acid export membrane protein
LLQFVLLWAAARILGEAGFGDFALALAVGYMVAQVADFGLQLFVQRELARLTIPGATGQPYFTDSVAANRLVGGGLTIKGALSLVALVIIAILVWMQPVENKLALLFVGLSSVLATVLDYLAYCFRALRRLQNEALANVFARGVNLLLGVGLLLMGGGVWGLALAGNLAMLAAIALLYIQLLRFVRPVWQPDWSFWRGQAWQPAALGLGIVFSVISFRIDNLLIAPLVGRAELGNYNVAYKLFEPSLILPAVVLAATFPMLSLAAKASRGAGFRSVFNNTMLLLFALGLFVTTSMLLLSVPVVKLLYGEQYGYAGGLLQVLALACLPMFLNYGLTHVLIALDKPHLFAAFTLSALLVNVGANLALLPTMGVMGAAVATIMAECTLLTLCAVTVWRELPRIRERARGAAVPVPVEAMSERTVERGSRMEGTY